MQLKADEEVCTLFHLLGFPESVAAGNTRESPYVWRGDPPETFAKFLEELAKKLGEFEEKRVSRGMTSMWKGSMILAAVNSTQPKSLEYLRKAGFNEIGPITYPKYNHKLSYMHVEPFPFRNRMVILLQEHCGLTKVEATNLLRTGSVDGRPTDY